MSIVDDAYRAEQAGYSAGYNGLDADVCPYQASSDPRWDFWMAGYKRAAESLAMAARQREATKRREAAAAAFEEKLTTFLGGDEFREEFEQWLAAFIDARTR